MCWGAFPVNSQYQVKPMLEEKVSLLQKYDDYLFGKNFRNHIVDIIKSKKQNKEIFIEHKNPFSFSSSHAPRKCERQNLFLTKTGSKKFHNGNQQQQQRQQRYTYYGQTGCQQQNMVGITAPDQTFFSMDLNPAKPTQWESRKVHPLIKSLLLSKSIPDVPLAGRLKHFVGAWVKITQDPKILSIVK